MVWFVGQERIRRELDYLIMAAGMGENYNVLLNAPSGMGKTTLGFILAVKIADDNFTHQIPQDGLVRISNRRLQFIDEVHLLSPPELLYGALDKGDKFFILATNSAGKLAEPLLNRCLEFQFDPYTSNEIKFIYEKSLRFHLENEFYEELVKISRVPREIHAISRRLNYIMKGNETFAEFENILQSIMGFQNSFSPHEIAYLEVLRDMDGKASLKTLAAVLSLEEEYLTRVIEPPLLIKKKIKITGRGRILWQQMASPSAVSQYVHTEVEK